MIHHPDNVVAISSDFNHLLNVFYSSKRSFTGGQTVRGWLNGKSYAEQFVFGQKMLGSILQGIPFPQ